VTSAQGGAVPRGPAPDSPAPDGPAPDGPAPDGPAPDGTAPRDTGTARPAREHGLLRSLVADPAFGPLRALLLLLTVVTGVVDAVSILALGRVFVANMTGNVVFAAFALAGAPGFSLGASLFALAGFLIGAYAGGLMITRTGPDRGALLRMGTLAEVALAAIALILAAATGYPGASTGTLHMTAHAFSPAVTDVLALLLATALGIQNAVARKLAVPDLTTTVLTMTLTGVGADLRAIIRGAGPGKTAARAILGRRLLAVATMVAGAAAGALLSLHVSPVSALCLAVALLAVAAGATVAATRRPAPWRLAKPAA
jgi:uncharacterized membrane protein YoaK (UPF0700 family)